MQFNNTEVQGFAHAFMGMRNPMNSWALSDSYTDKNGKFIIGKKDMTLATKLIKSGSEHYKYLRQIHVWVDIEMPRYWWSEFDTYKFNNKNSTSTMHKLLNNKLPITKDMFVSHSLIDDVLDIVIIKLEELRQMYMGIIETPKDIDKNELLVSAKRLLPEGMEQLRTVDTNYAELRNIYHQRKHHRLTEEWIDTFCAWIKTLPYAQELIIMDY
ncbi:hypothetical protein AN639_07720 [Candidatus Epulonipiscium fishelsonii]|uniref:Uncharacterized protein n=1 Tax=Candidatus Epulonipiscium fishelsonii TaxID=77094 RepID=A0ACC8XBG3_9FIRM|nr:hypothetical protein AN639_07720 [Epulopiscium sp. SCG-B05WGA-EpuloA1]ONI39782.1 hypothetical protein AN396_06920 [Epulopiscium sp. SCG-B11WGA-EpuloA1]